MRGYKTFIFWVATFTLLSSGVRAWAQSAPSPPASGIRPTPHRRTIMPPPRRPHRVPVKRPAHRKPASAAHTTAVQRANYETQVAPSMFVSDAPPLASRTECHHQPHWLFGCCLEPGCCSEPVGQSLQAHMLAQIQNGQQQRLTLFEYDFQNDPAADVTQLNQAGRQKLARLLPLINSTGYPLIIEESTFGPAVSDARKNEVWEYLTTNLGTTLSETQIQVRVPTDAGLRGAEAIEIDRNQLKTTRAQGIAPSSFQPTGSFSGSSPQNLQIR